MYYDYVVQTKSKPHMVIRRGTTTDPRQTLYDLFIAGEYSTYDRFSYQLAVIRQYEEQETATPVKPVVSGKGVRVTNLETNEVKTFSDVSECSQFYGVDGAGIYARLAGTGANPTSRGKLKNLFFERC